MARRSGHHDAGRSRDAMVGMLVMKFLWPIAKRRARRKAAEAARSSAGAVARNPRRVAVLIGAIAGAIGWFASRKDTTRSPQE